MLDSRLIVVFFLSLSFPSVVMSMYNICIITSSCLLPNASFRRYVHPLHSKVVAAAPSLVSIFFINNT